MALSTAILGFGLSFLLKSSKFKGLFFGGVIGGCTGLVKFTRGSCEFC